MTVSQQAGRKTTIDLTIVSTIEFWGSLSFQLSSFGADYRFAHRFAYRVAYLFDYFLRVFAIFIFSWVGTTLHCHGIDHGLDLGSAIVL